MSERIQSFDAFWPYYLGEHRNRTCRGLHYVGTSCAILSVVASIVTLQPLGLLGAAFSGYFFAWIGHFFVEHNRPATFTYPAWSLRADFKMYFLAVTGQLAKDPAFQAQCLADSPTAS